MVSVPKNSCPLPVTPERVSFAVPGSRMSLTDCNVNFATNSPLLSGSF